MAWLTKTMKQTEKTYVPNGLGNKYNEQNRKDMNLKWFGASSIEKERPGYGPLDGKYKKHKKDIKQRRLARFLARFLTSFLAGALIGFWEGKNHKYSVRCHPALRKKHEKPQRSFRKPLKPLTPHLSKPFKALCNGFPSLFLLLICHGPAPGQSAHR